MKVFSSHKELLKSLDSGELIGLVPTMGSLHEGHLSLIKRAIDENVQTIVTIYVNPTQFNDKNDLNKYPRNLKSDLDKLKHLQNIFIYAPQDKDLYKEVEAKKYNLDDLDKVLEGKFRPGHFNGVATIVEKFFNLFNPNNAYFGEKDFQQLTIIKTIVKKLNLNINIIACTTVRETDGLAMSSRNILMTEEERLNAGIVSKIMIKAREIYNNKKIEIIPKSLKTEINSLKNCQLEYFEIENLSKYSECIENEGSRIFIAYKVGRTRIIDNLPLK